MTKIRFKLIVAGVLFSLASANSQAYDYSWNSIDNQMRQGQFAVQQQEAARRAQEMQMLQQGAAEQRQREQNYIQQNNDRANRQHQNFNPYLNNFGN